MSEMDYPPLPLEPDADSIVELADDVINWPDDYPPSHEIELDPQRDRQLLSALATDVAARRHDLHPAKTLGLHRVHPNAHIEGEVKYYSHRPLITFSLAFIRGLDSRGLFFWADKLTVWDDPAQPSYRDVTITRMTSLDNDETAQAYDEPPEPIVRDILSRIVQLREPVVTDAILLRPRFGRGVQGQ